MAAFDPRNQHHQAALDRVETVEALACWAQFNAALADAADHEGVDGEPLRDAARVLVELGQIEADRAVALVGEAEA